MPDNQNSIAARIFPGGVIPKPKIPNPRQGAVYGALAGGGLGALLSIGKDDDGEKKPLLRNMLLGALGGAGVGAAAPAVKNLISPPKPTPMPFNPVQLLGAGGAQ